MFLPICKLTDSANFGKVLPMKLNSYSAVQVIKFILFSSLFCKVLGEKTKISTAQQYFFSSSCMFLDKKTFLKTRLNPGLNLSIFWGTGPWYYSKNRWKRGRGCKAIHLSEGFHLSRNDRKIGVFQFVSTGLDHSCCWALKALYCITWPELNN